MLIVMHMNATPREIEDVCDRIRQLGFVPNKIPGSTRVAIGITGNAGAVDEAAFTGLPGIAEAVPISRPWKA